MFPAVERIPSAGAFGAVLSDTVGASSVGVSSVGTSSVGAYSSEDGFVLNSLTPSSVGLICMFPSSSKDTSSTQVSL